MSGPSGSSGFVEEQVHTIKSNVFELIETLSVAQITRLYDHPPTCLGLFKLLPTLSKVIVSRLVMLPEGFPTASVESWFHDHGQSVYLRARRRLESLKILLVSGDRLNLRPEFQRNLWFAFTGGGPSHVFGKPLTTVAVKATDMEQDTPMDSQADGGPKEAVTLEFLEKYSADQWEAVLHYMCRTEGTSQIHWTKDPPKGVLRLLESSGLMQKSGADDDEMDLDSRPSKRANTVPVEDAERLRITSKGFQFLLQDVNTQIWAFLLQYVDLADELGMDQVEMIQMLFLLGSMQHGIGYSTETPLTITQQYMLLDLRNLGIVYQRKKKSTTFYPTPLATTLTSGAMVSAKKEEAGFIVLETNYRLYAYTSSPLQISVLALFTDLKARFRNMVVGMITRESMREAFAHGITAQQIVQYLSAHAHPILRRENNVLPPTVLDQLRLWELERNRLSVSYGYYYHEFMSDKEYEDIARYAETLGGLVARKEGKGGLAERGLFVKDFSHNAIKEFVRQKKQRGE